MLLKVLQLLSHLIPLQQTNCTPTGPGLRLPRHGHGQAAHAPLLMPLLRSTRRPAQSEIPSPTVAQIRSKGLRDTDLAAALALPISDSRACSVTPRGLDPARTEASLWESPQSSTRKKRESRAGPHVTTSPRRDPPRELEALNRTRLRCSWPPCSVGASLNRRRRGSRWTSRACMS